MQHLLIILVRRFVFSIGVAQAVDGGFDVALVLVGHHEHFQLPVIPGQVLGVDLVGLGIQHVLALVVLDGGLGDGCDARADNRLGNTGQVGQRGVDDRDDAHQDDHLHHHGQAAGHAHALFFIELHLLLLELLLVLGVLFLNPFQAGRQPGPVRLALLRLQGQGEGGGAHDQGKQENGHEIVAHKPVDKPEHIPQGYTDDIENGVHTSSMSFQSWSSESGGDGGLFRPFFSGTGS